MENNFNILVTASIDQGLVNMINLYFESDKINKRTELFERAIERIAIREAAVIDFQNNRFDEANQKLIVLDSQFENDRVDYRYFVR
jgi:hypothetical protein